jgi:hypothetical protein
MDKRLRGRLRQAVELALAGDWQAAHQIAQDHEGERLANWIHAIVHRMEGDTGNAAHWYGRCGRSGVQELTTDDELRLILAELD